MYMKTHSTNLVTEWAKSTLRKEKPEGAYTYDNLKKCITPYFSDNNVTQLFYDTLDSVFKLTPLLPDQAWECLLGLVMESHMLKNPLSHQQEALLDFLSIYISLEPDCDTAVKNFMLHYPRCEKCFPLVKQQFLYKRSKR
jgi:hypothetical protein